MVLSRRLYRLWDGLIKGIRVVQLRTKDGVILESAYKKENQQKLRKVFEKASNLKGLKTVRMRDTYLKDYRTAKKELKEDGFTFQISTYGTFMSKDKTSSTIKRTEILSKTKFSGDDVLTCYDIFGKFPQKEDLSLFLYRQSDKSLAKVVI